MALTRDILGKFLELRDNRNSDLSFGLDDVRGVNNLKQLMPTKADLNGRDLTKFQIVYPGEFVFNHRTSRNGSKFSIAYNDGKNPVICTEDYVVFKIRDDCNDKLDPRWLYMYFNRPEFDRYVITNSWGSSTEFYNWEDICSIELEIPVLHIQHKFVEVYNAMLANQKSYERGLDDLKLTCDAYIEDLRKKVPSNKIGQYIREVDIRNKNMQVTLLQGFCMSGDFIEPRRVSIDIPSLKILEKGNLVYNRAVECVSDRFIVAQRHGETCAVSNSYIIFTSINEEILLNKYLLLWLRRAEFARYSKFMSHGTAHENFEYSDMEDVAIPIPDIRTQYAIVNIYEALAQRKEINERLKKQIKDICPILIRGSIEEARKEA